MTAQEYISSKKLTQESDRDIAGIVWYDENISQEDQIKISFELFDRSPVYGIVAELKMAYTEMEPAIKNVLWSKYNYYLKLGNDKQKEQIKYSLWADFFEDQNTVNEAWLKFVNLNSEDDTLRHILPISGPVPYDKKEKLYSIVIADKQYHDCILESLFGSFFDVFGQINVQKARVLLSNLELNRQNEMYQKLNDYLYRYNSKDEYIEYVNNNKN